MTLRPRQDRPVGVYLHIPFCERVCPYCDFAVTARRHIPHHEYAHALLAELEARRREALAGRDLRTIYLGGGTPSRWDDDALERVLATLLAACDPVEVTLEANPTDVSPARLARWRQAGVTRVSLGVQSFQPRVLRALGRNHDAQQALRATRAVLEGGELALSIDLIYGGPDHSAQEWEQDLAVVASLTGLRHLSAYNLTVEPKTPFARQRERGLLRVVDEEGCAWMMQRLIQALADLGLRQYEVSSFAALGHEAVHNSGYWLGAEYLGLGVGAHSLTIHEGVAVRRANTRHLAHYLRDPVGAQATTERLSAQEHLLERLYVNLRTTLGLCWSTLREQVSQDADASALLTRAQPLLEELVAQGLLWVRAHSADDPARVYGPTPRGLMLADVIASRVFDLEPST